MTDYAICWFRSDLRTRPQVVEMTDGALGKIGAARGWDREVVRAKLQAGQTVETSIGKWVMVREPGV